MGENNLHGVLKDHARSVRELTRCALLVAMLAVSSYIAFPLPFSPVPVSAQTLAVTVVALILPSGQAFKTVSLYLILGAIGAPVFASGASGVGVFVGPTGGFLAGFLAAAVAMSALRERIFRENSFKAYLLIASIGALIIYFFGVLWMMIVTSLNLSGVFTAAVLPFIPGDIFKCSAAAFVARALNKNVKLN